MKKILLIEDDINLSDQIYTYLNENSYDVTQCYSYKDVLNKVNSEYDLALLDINLPDNEGINLLAILRENDIRVIITTVKNDEKFIVKALDNGADDYITKPFKLSILRARIDKTLRTVPIMEDEVIFKDLYLDKKGAIIYYKKQRLELTALEYEIMSLFINNPNRIFTRDYLLERFWDERERFVNDNTLTATIKRIRDKSSKDIITTIRGIGYRLD